MNQNGVMFIEGQASTVDVDETGERMSEEAIAKMAARLVGKPLRSEHGKGWDDKLGEIVLADVIKDQNGNPCLWIKAKLHDWSSKAKDLFKLLNSGAEMGLSVAGAVRPGGIVKEFIQKLGKFIPTYKDIEPTEVSITDHPANLNTFANAVSKSLFAQEAEIEKSGLEAVDRVLEEADKKDEDVEKSSVNDGKLLAFQRFFNQEKQRGFTGKSPSEWEQIGNHLAEALTQETQQEFLYTNEKVINKKLLSFKEDTMKKGALASSQVNGEVSSFIKQFEATKPGYRPVEKASSTPSTSSSSPTSSTSTPSTSTSSTSTPSSTPSSSTTGSDSSTSTASTLDALMSDLETTMPSSNSSTTSTDKGMSSNSVSSQSSQSSAGSSSDIKDTSHMGSSSSSVSSDSSNPESMNKADDMDYMDDPDMVECMKAFAQVMKGFMGKKLAKASKQPVDGNGSSSSSSVGSAPGSTSGIVDTSRIGGSSSSSASSSMSKSTDEKVLLIMKSMTEEIKSLRTQVSNIPNERKSIARVIDKKFADEEVRKSDEGEESSAQFLKKLQQDPEITHAEFHKFQTYGIVPEKYEKN